MKKDIFILSVVYFLVRLSYLTKLPIFNDEAIYLDWGWRAINMPGHLFVSLQDAKQPFLMWIFGISQNIFSDPLFAGRFISVLAGSLSGLGIYLLGQKLFDKAVARLAFIFYLAVPVFSFFDRQALMESALAALGVWTFYLFLKVKKSQRLFNAFLLGCLLGISIFVKSTGMYFSISILFLSLHWLLTVKKNKQSKILNLLILAFYTSQIILLPLYLQKTFWQTFQTNSRYVLTAYEIVKLPLSHWLQNFKSSNRIIFWYFTPGILFLSVLGIIFIFLKSRLIDFFKSDLKQKKTERFYLIFWVVSQIFLLVLLVRRPSPRYLMPFLPLLTLLAAYGIKTIYLRQKFITAIFLGLSLIFPSLLTIFQIFSPLTYFNVLGQLASFSQKRNYVLIWPSGYGVPETRDFLKDKAKDKSILVGVRLDFGNPESAIFTYFHKIKNINVIYFDGRLMPDISKIDCLTSDPPFYFVSRDEQLTHLAKFLKEEKRFYKPEAKSFVGIYTLEDNCQGKTANIIQALKRT